MSADEKNWMAGHGAFLDNLLEQGVIVAHGPVMDPAGGYGVSLYRIADDQQIETFTSRDPIVANGGPLRASSDAASEGTRLSAEAQRARISKLGIEAVKHRQKQ